MIDFTELKPNKPLAIQLAKRELVSLVYNAVHLEGVMMTLTEVQTLLDGITVSGHKISDQNMALNQSQAWQHIFDLVKNNSFVFDKPIACHIHAIADKDETLAWGHFRTGFVTIAGSTYVPSPPDMLDKQWLIMTELVRHQTSTYDKAITACLQMSRNQFYACGNYGDINKRMGRFMMNGILLNAGLPIINVPASRQAEFNSLMLAFYDSNDMSTMNTFLRSCLDERLLRNFI